MLQEVERLVEVDGGLAGSIRIVADMAEDEAENSAHLGGNAKSGWRPKLAMYDPRHVLGAKTRESIRRSGVTGVRINQNKLSPQLVARQSNI